MHVLATVFVLVADDVDADAWLAPIFPGADTDDTGDVVDILVVFPPCTITESLPRILLVGKRSSPEVLSDDVLQFLLLT